MSSMSHCKWENTAADLAQCVRALEDGTDTLESLQDEFLNGYPDELRGMARVVDLAERLLEMLTPADIDIPSDEQVSNYETELEGKVK